MIINNIFFGFILLSNKDGWGIYISEARFTLAIKKQGSNK